MRATILQLLIALVITISVKAQDIGKIVIRNAMNTNPVFIASLNGIRLNNQYASSVAFDFLDDYNYRVKILQSGSTNALFFNINSAPNYISIYALNKDAFGNYALLLESKSLLSNQVTTNTVVITPTVVISSTAVCTNSLSGSVSDADFIGIYKTIQNESFDNTRVDMAKSIFNNSKLSASQVLELVKLLSFDKKRVELAKFAYSRVYDKHNFYKVYNGFDFSSSKKEVMEYIKNNP